VIHFQWSIIGRRVTWPGIAILTLVMAACNLMYAIPYAHTQPPPESILVVDPNAGTNGRGMLFRVDPSTRLREVVSDFGNEAQGPRGVNPEKVAVSTAGGIVVLDPDAGTEGLGALFSIVPSSGRRILFHDFGDEASGPLGVRPTNLAIEATGTILVTDLATGEGDGETDGGLFRVNGLRDLISVNLLEQPSGVAVDASGNILVTDTGLESADPGRYFILSPSGARLRTVELICQGLSGFPEGTTDPFGIAVGASGTVFITDTGFSGRLLRVDNVNQCRVLTQFPTQEPPSDPEGVAVSASGDVLVATRATGLLFRVNPEERRGRRELLHDFKVAQGDGPTGRSPSGVATINIPITNLSLAGSGSPDTVPVGGVLTYSFSVINAGPSAATVILSVALPETVVFLSTDRPDRCSAATVDDRPGVRCNFGGLVGSISVNILVSPRAEGPITSTARVEGQVFDTDHTDNTMTINTTVTPAPPADVAIISKTDVPDPVTVGTPLRYTVEAVNNGPGTATSITITDTLPAGVTFISASGRCNEASGIVTCNFGNIGSGTRFGPIITVTPTVVGTLTNTARVVSTAPDPDPDNNMGTENTTVLPPIPGQELVNERVDFEPLPDTFTTSLDPTECPAGFVGRFSFEARLPNVSDRPLTTLQVVVATLTNGNLLQNADGGPGGVGALLTVPEADGFADGVLSPGEFVDVPFVICLTQIEPFTFLVNVLGIVP
jgi:uncharacterized repeat protein (TIGR01451 family)